MDGDALEPGAFTEKFLVNLVENVIAARKGIVVPVVPRNDFAQAVGHCAPAICKRPTSGLVDGIVSKEMLLRLHDNGELRPEAIGAKSLEFVFDLA